MITIGACSPSWSSSAVVSALVDSASDGRNDVDSLFSASENLPGRFAPMIATTATSQIPATTNFEVLPVARVSSLDIVGRAANLIGIVARPRYG